MTGFLVGARATKCIPPHPSATTGTEDRLTLSWRELFHQFVVDMYAKIESERLLYIRLNQTKLRSEQYIHLRDTVIKARCKEP